MNESKSHPFSGQIGSNYVCGVLRHWSCVLCVRSMCALCALCVLCVHSVCTPCKFCVCSGGGAEHAGLLLAADLAVPRGPS